MEFKPHHVATIASTESIQIATKSNSKTILRIVDWIAFLLTNVFQFAGGLFFIIGSSLSIANVRYYFNSNRSYSITVAVFYVLGSVCFVLQAVAAWIQESISKRRQMLRKKQQSSEESQQTHYMRRIIATAITFTCLASNFFAAFCFLGGSIAYCFYIANNESSTSLFISIVLWCIGSYGMLIGKFFILYSEHLLSLLPSPKKQQLQQPSKLVMYKESCSPCYFVNQLLYLGILGFVSGSTCFIFTLPWQFSASVVDFMDITGSVLWILGSFSFVISGILVVLFSILEKLIC